MHRQERTRQPRSASGRPAIGDLRSPTRPAAAVASATLPGTSALRSQSAPTSTTPSAMRHRDHGKLAFVPI